MSRSVERVSGAVRRVDWYAIWEVVDVGADVRKVVCRPSALFDVPTFNCGVDRRFIVAVYFGLSGVARNRDAGYNDGRDDPEDRHDGQQFHQRETRSFANTNRFHSNSPVGP